MSVLAVNIIYTLVDPLTDEVRYVGKTSGSKRRRLLDHIRDARNGSRRWVHSWMRGLLETGLAPIMDAIEIVPDDMASERERYWIAFYRQRGCRLTNLTEGGDGQAGYKFTAEDRRRMSESRTKRKTRVCVVCGNQFDCVPSHIARAGGNLCSVNCAGVAHARRYAERTHCRKGHPLSGANLFVTEDGCRVCRECRRQYYRRRYADEKRRRGLGEVKSRTHCGQGHRLEEGNVYVRKNGWRACAVCHRARQRRRRHANRQEAA